MEEVRALREDKKLGSGGGVWRKTWEKCKSFNHTKPTTQRSSSSVLLGSVSNTNTSNTNTNTTPPNASPYMAKSKSWSTLYPRTPTTPRGGGVSGNKWGRSLSKKLSLSRSSSKVGLSTPKGCLSVYVGPERERFIIKVECTSHPLFKLLLEEAESEYGFHSDGPLVLPCDPDMFSKVLFQMESDRHDDYIITHSTCSPRGRTSYHHLPPSSSTTSLNNY
ncbi:uncharacterized protein LOC141641962 [Silene latifolia]|uniref:uncharacterized protein LOC141641962 n=1 Tax=Silene latifolia TaxID=37657 RepID=UPI003D76D584